MERRRTADTSETFPRLRSALAFDSMTSVILGQRPAENANERKVSCGPPRAEAAARTVLRTAKTFNIIPYFASHKGCKSAIPIPAVGGQHNIMVGRSLFSRILYSRNEKNDNFGTKYLTNPNENYENRRINSNCDDYEYYAFDPLFLPRQGGRHRTDGSRRHAVDSGSLRRHQSAALRGSRVREPAAATEKTDILSGRGDQMRPRHTVRPEFQIQPHSASRPGEHLHQIRRRPRRGRLQGSGEVSEESVVRQRHTPPLLERQVPSRVLARVVRGDARQIRRHQRDADRCGAAVRRDLRSCALPHAPQPDRRRGSGGHVGLQLLRERDHEGGGGFLRRDGRSRRPPTDLVRPELQAGERRFGQDHGASEACTRPPYSR